MRKKCSLARKGCNPVAHTRVRQALHVPVLCTVVAVVVVVVVAQHGRTSRLGREAPSRTTTTHVREAQPRQRRRSECFCKPSQKDNKKGLRLHACLFTLNREWEAIQIVLDDQLMDGCPQPTTGLRHAIASRLFPKRCALITHILCIDTLRKNPE